MHFLTEGDDEKASPWTKSAYEQAKFEDDVVPNHRHGRAPHMQDVIWREHKHGKLSLASKGIKVD